jgi:serine phosphatase RsbU (regulator of sigma subunit)
MLQHASLVRPCQGERVSGDAVVVVPLDGGLLAAIVDVLGHGPPAHELAVRIDAYLTRYGSADVAGLMKRLHAHLRGTRGAAVGLCALDAAAGRAEYVGVGNTVLRRFGNAETRLPSRYGVLGQNMPTPRPQVLELEAGDLVLLYTDGVSDHFSRDDYPGLGHEAPAAVVRKVVERFGKDHDDAGCIALRFEPPAH